MFLASCVTSNIAHKSFSDRKQATNLPNTEKVKDICSDQSNIPKVIPSAHEKECFGDYGADPLNLPLPRESSLPYCNAKTHPHTWHKCFGRVKSYFYEFEGEFLNGKRDGIGRYKNSPGKVYVGNWENDLPNGIGVFKNTWDDRFKFKTKIVKGKWENGTLVEAHLQNFDLKDEVNRLIEQKGYKIFLNESEELLFNFFLYRAYENIQCIDDDPQNWSFCTKEILFTNGEKYSGQWKNGKFDGRGTYFYKDGSSFTGEWKSGEKDGIGEFWGSNFSKKTQYWDFGIEINYERYKEKINRNVKKYDPNTLTRKNESKLELEITTSIPKDDGSFLIKIKNIEDLASLKINNESVQLPKSNILELKKFAKAGKETQFTIVATDINGNTDTKTITVNRPIAESQAKFAALNPAQVKKQPERDAVAIIIGIADYKNLPRADFANDDASVFYDYAIRALGIKPENIKLLVDGNADDVAIYQAFKTWLPSRVRATTDVYVYYSGHGLPAEDGQGLYLLPQRAHRDLIEKTAISQREINGFIQAAKAKSVTIFLDSCYSGLARTGETLLASARPVTLKADKKLFPDEFTVITASQADQISSSSPDLKHGIFSYYLMRGMEGEADTNRDGKITLGEMQTYLVENVGRQAGMMNRKQEPQLVGDANRVLIGW